MLTAKFLCGNQPVKRNDISRYAESTVVFFTGVEHVVERADDLAFEFCVDVVLFPIKVLQVLHPFEVTYDDAAAVAENIGKDFDAFFVKDFVRFHRGRSVCRFDNDFRLDSVGVFSGDLVFECGGNKDVAGEFQKLRIRDSLAVAGVAVKKVLAAVEIFVNAGDVKTVFVVNRAAYV